MKNKVLFEITVNILMINTNEFVDKILNFFIEYSNKPDIFMKEFSIFLSLSFNCTFYFLQIKNYFL